MFLRYWPNEQYSYRTYYEKVVQNLILNNFSIIYSVKILIVWPLLRTEFTKSVTIATIIFTL